MPIIDIYIYPLISLSSLFISSYRWQKDSNGLPYEAINHSPNAVYVAQYTANFFVDLTRQSSHRFSSASDENDRLIFNYHTTRTGPDFVESYYFDNNFY
jgi:gamma-glutamyl hydrolase